MRWPPGFRWISLRSIDVRGLPYSFVTCYLGRTRLTLGIYHSYYLLLNRDTSILHEHYWVYIVVFNLLLIRFLYFKGFNHFISSFKNHFHHLKLLFNAVLNANLNLSPQLLVFPHFLWIPIHAMAGNQLNWISQLTYTGSIVQVDYL